MPGGGKRGPPRRATDAEVRRALIIAAQLVAERGEAFLPIFLRLEAEVAKLEDKASAMARARSAAASRAGEVVNLWPERSARA